MPSKRKKLSTIASDSNSNSNKHSILTFFKATKSVDFSGKREFIQQKLQQSPEVVENQEKDRENSKELIDALKIEKKRNEALEKQLKQAKRMLHDAARLNLEKDMEIARLKTIVDGKNDVLPQNRNAQNEFEEFSGAFSREQLKKLASFKSGTLADYKFVQYVLQSLYTDHTDLLSRSATGKKYKGIEKQAISPAKRELIHVVFKKRIGNESGGEQKDRLGRLDYLIGQTIQNMRKKQKDEHSKALRKMHNQQQETNG